MMRRSRPRVRGLGCLGCLPLGGLFALLLPVIVIGLVIYWLVSRRQPGTRFPSQPAPPSSSGYFCSHCGKPVQAAEKFCPHCGSKAG